MTCAPQISSAESVAPPGPVAGAGGRAVAEAVRAAVRAISALAHTGMNRRTGPGRVPFAENPGGVGAKRVSIFSASFAGKDFVTRGEESGTNRPAGGTSCALRKWLNVRNLARIKSVYVYVQNRMSK